MNKQKQKKHSKQQLEKLVQIFDSQQLTKKRRFSLSQRQINKNYASISNPETLRLSKDNLIHQFTSNLKQKLSLDMHARKALQEEQNNKLSKLMRIQAEISAINRKNQEQINHLSLMEKTLLKKVQQEMKRDKYEQQKLLKEYYQLKKQQHQIQLTKSVKKIKQREDWIIMEQEQRKMQLMARSFQQKQLRISLNKSLIDKTKLKKQQVQQTKKGEGKIQKKQIKRKNVEDIKEMGRQFLQHAKRVQAQKLKAGTKLLDVYKKSIDYLPQLKSLLSSNAEDLSKPIESTHQLSKKKPKRLGSFKNLQIN